jgi:hypothetical protein
MKEGEMSVAESTAALTAARREPDLVAMPARRALVIDGLGAPGDESFRRGLQALFGIAYTIRFARKHDGGGEFPMSPLEADWRVLDDGGAEIRDRDRWQWRLRIAVPDDVTAAEVRRAVARATSKKGGALFESPEAKRVTLVRIPPTRYGRILHVGPYAAEPESFDTLQALLDRRGLERDPAHTEVYLSDPGRTAPERLRTVLLVRVHPANRG